MPRREYAGECFRIAHAYEPCGPNPSNPFNYYDDTLAITVLLQGEATCNVEGNVYTLCPGDLVVLSPSEIRSFRFNQTGVHERLSLYFSQALLSTFWDSELSLLSIFNAHPTGHGNRIARGEYREEPMALILKELCALADECDAQTPMRDSRIHLLLLSLLFLLYDARKKSRYEGEAERDPAVQAVCRYVTEHLTESLTLHRLQQALLVSRYQLTVAFPRATGMTLSEYVLHKRLAHAMAAIRSGEPLEKAAEEAGFGSYSYFFKAFRRRYGTSPRAYFTKK